MSRVWSQFIGGFVILLATSGIVTGAFFNDVESSYMNIFAALKLDGKIKGDGFDDRICGIGSYEKTEFSFKNIGMMPFEYKVDTTSTTGDEDFCALLELTAYRNGDEVYEGPIAEFNAGLFPLNVDESDVWRLKVKIPWDADVHDVSGKTCSFDTVFAANQEDFVYGEAFYDIETLSHTIVGAIGGGGGLGDITIITNNTATVTNNVDVSSNTGGNSANGGNGGEGGDGGDGGEGGDGGYGSDGEGGGTVETGDATSSVSIVNEVNTTEIFISACDCSCPENGDCGDDKKDDWKEEKVVLIETVPSEESEEEDEEEVVENIVLIETTSSTSTTSSEETATSSERTRTQRTKRT